MNIRSHGMSWRARPRRQRLAESASAPARAADEQGRPHLVEPHGCAWPEVTAKAPPSTRPTTAIVPLVWRAPSPSRAAPPRRRPRHRPRSQESTRRSFITRRSSSRICRAATRTRAPAVEPPRRRRAARTAGRRGDGPSPAARTGPAHRHDLDEPCSCSATTVRLPRQPAARLVRRAAEEHVRALPPFKNDATSCAASRASPGSLSRRSPFHSTKSPGSRWMASKWK